MTKQVVTNTSTQEGKNSRNLVTGFPVLKSHWAGCGKTFCTEGYKICFPGKVSHAVDLLSPMHGTEVWENLFASITLLRHI